MALLGKEHRLISSNDFAAHLSPDGDLKPKTWFQCEALQCISHCVAYDVQGYLHDSWP